MNFFLKNKSITILIVVFVCIGLVLKVVVDNRLCFVKLASKNTVVNENTLRKDIDSILAVYGLQKDASILLQSKGDSIYDMYYKNDKTSGKSIFISARPIFIGSRKNYTEIQTLMELWLYVINRTFEYDIDGITYFFTAPTELLQGLSPNMIYMSRDQFMSLYKNLNTENMSHKKILDALTKEYITKTNYKRNPGHIQVGVKTQGDGSPV